MKEKNAAVLAVLPPLWRAEAQEAPEPERKVWRTPKRVARKRRMPRLRAQNVRAPPRERTTKRSDLGEGRKTLLHYKIGEHKAR